MTRTNVDIVAREVDSTRAPSLKRILHNLIGLIVAAARRSAAASGPGLKSGSHVLWAEQRKPAKSCASVTADDLYRWNGKGSWAGPLACPGKPTLETEAVRLRHAMLRFTEQRDILKKLR